MKSADEIRQHRNDLLVCKNIPCDCKGPTHQAKCDLGGKMMTAVIEALSWALGENQAHQVLVDRLAKNVKAIIASN